MCQAEPGEVVAEGDGACRRQPSRGDASSPIVGVPKATTAAPSPSLIPDAQFEVMEEESHQPFQEVPDDWNARADAFWREVDGRS